MQKFSSLIAGILFGAGLTISQMINPMKVLNFLDLTGNFDLTLILVMASGLVVTLIGYQIIFLYGKPLVAKRFDLPATNLIDQRLIVGAILFGLGWGISGICPGPAIAGLVFGNSLSLVFVIAMAAGILAAKFATTFRNAS